MNDEEARLNTVESKQQMAGEKPSSSVESGSSSVEGSPPVLPVPVLGQLLQALDQGRDADSKGDKGDDGKRDGDDNALPDGQGQYERGLKLVDLVGAFIAARRCDDRAAIERYVSNYRSAVLLAMGVVGVTPADLADFAVVENLPREVRFFVGIGVLVLVGLSLQEDGSVSLGWTQALRKG